MALCVRDPTLPGAVLERALAEGQFPGAVAIFGTENAVSEPICVGVRAVGGPATTADTRYDLASLTKVVSTLPAILRLVADGRLTLDDTVGQHIANAGWFQSPTLATVTVRELLAHTSGLAAWIPFYAHASDRLTALGRVLQEPVTAAQRGGAPVYSDLGFIVLGALVERVTRERQDVYVQREVFDRLGLTDTRYGPVPAPVAATEDCGWRNRVLSGEVHDENCYRLDGVSGHAGLFGTADDLARYARAWLTRDSRLGPPDLLDACTSTQSEGTGLRRGYGWLLRGVDSFGGNGATELGFGHTGFTGTSLWIDPGGGWFAVLLTNRVHPSRKGGEKIHAIRREFHDAVAGVVAG